MIMNSAMQQKLIGENLSHFVKIRQFVGINSQLMRAMRLVVGQNGLSVAKVAILIGGPDWPVSFLPSRGYHGIIVIFSSVPLCELAINRHRYCVE